MSIVGKLIFPKLAKITVEEENSFMGHPVIICNVQQYTKWYTMNLNGVGGQLQ